MSLLDRWRGWRERRRAALMWEAGWMVSLEYDTIRVVDHTGSGGSLPLHELAVVMVETNDNGPWGADVWWLLFRADETLGIGWPQGATGEGAVLDCLSALPGFNHEAMLSAMTSTDNASFALWRRDASQAEPG